MAKSNALVVLLLQFLGDYRLADIVEHRVDVACISCVGPVGIDLVNFLLCPAAGGPLKENQYVIHLLYA